MKEKHNYIKLQSDTVSFLRFPLIVGVVFIHSYFTEMTYQGIVFKLDADYPIYDTVSFFISNIFARLAVPLFFLTSGFYFFYKIKEYGREVYLSKLKKRCKSLLIPYLFWIALVVLLYFIAQQIPYTADLFSGNRKLIIDYSFLDYLNTFWAIDDGKYPFLYPLWFIRDLIIAVVLSPLIYFFIKKCPFLFLIVLFLLWFLNIPTVVGFAWECYFFFSLGAFFSIKKFNLVEFARKKQIQLLSYLYLPVCLVDFLTRESSIIMCHQLVHKIGIILGIIFIFNIVSLLIESNKIRVSSFLGGASFFCFCYS